MVVTSEATVGGRHSVPYTITNTSTNTTRAYCRRPASRWTKNDENKNTDNKRKKYIGHDTGRGQLSHLAWAYDPEGS